MEAGFVSHAPVAASVDAVVDAAVSEPPKGFNSVEVLSVRHWTDRLFHFSVARPATFRFRSGEFAMIGLTAGGKPLVRAYSMASPAWADTLDFYSIKVADGPLTSRLQRIAPGDRLLLGRKPTGTLVLDALRPGKRLFMFATGTGVAPFASLVRDPEVYEKFDQVILTHTCRDTAELAYGRELVAALRADDMMRELMGEGRLDKLTHIVSTTREPQPLMGRITTLIETGALYDHAPGGPLDPAQDRVMICGSTAMLKDLKALCEARGFEEGANNKPADYVVERAFVG